MKRLLTAAAALSLLAGGTALARQAAPSPDAGSGQVAGSMAQPGGATPPTSTPDTTMGGAAPTPAPMAAPPAQDPGMSSGSAGAMASGSPAPAPTAGAPAMDSGAAETADTPSAAPGSYPACTHKGQDRCTQSTAAAKGVHKKKMS